MDTYTFNKDGILFEDLVIEWTVTGLEEPEANVTYIAQFEGEPNMLESKNPAIKALAEWMRGVIEDDADAEAEAIEGAGFSFHNGPDGNPYTGSWRVSNA